MRKPRTNPCATPKLILSRIDEILSIQTYYILFVRFKPFISCFSNSGFLNDIMINCVKCFLEVNNKLVCEFFVKCIFDASDL